MLKIKDVVNGVEECLKKQGLSNDTIKQNMYTFYHPIINYHLSKGYEYYSPDITMELCERQRMRYENGEIGRKHYRAFVTAEFRIRSFVETGKVDFSIVKDSKHYKPSIEYMVLTENILNKTNFQPKYKYLMSIFIRNFFCFFEKRKTSINEITNDDFFEFIKKVSNTNPASVGLATHALRIILTYINECSIADLVFDLSIFRPQKAPRKIIEAYTQEEISSILSVINNETSKTPKRDYAMILLSFNSGIRAIDIRNLKLTDIDWKLGEVKIIQKKTVKPLTVSLNGKTLNAIADYILHERPKSESNNIFLQACPPFLALKSTSPLDAAIDKYCRIASVPKIKSRSFHSLRRSYAIELAKAEVPITIISQLLGHQGFSSGKIYLSFNKTHTALCAADFSDVPISKGFYSSPYFLKCFKDKKGGDE